VSGDVRTRVPLPERGPEGFRSAVYGREMFIVSPVSVVPVPTWIEVMPRGVSCWGLLFLAWGRLGLRLGKMIDWIGVG
jgi:hypothetical protein